MRKGGNRRRLAVALAAPAVLALAVAGAATSRSADEREPAAPSAPAAGAGPDARPVGGELALPAVQALAGREVRSAGRGRSRARAAEARWGRAMAAARRYAADRDGDVGFAVVGPRSGMAGFHVSRRAPAASTIKSLLLAAYLRLRSVRDRPLRPGERALLEPMIRWSDNGAATVVATIVGGGAVTRLARAAGMRDFEWVGARGWLGGLSQVSARDLAGYFHDLPRYLPGRHRRYALHLLHAVVPEQLWGVGEVVPRGWRLYLKGGWGISDDDVGTVEHQAALLERGRCRVSLAILTEHNPDEGYGIETLEGVARRLLRALGPAPC